MAKNPYFKEKVKAIEVNRKSVSELLDAMANTGFQGRKLAEVAHTWEKMVKDPRVTILFGYAASLSTTGQWKIVNWLIENRYIDVLVATGANLSEDIVEAMGNSYWKGSHLENDLDLLKTDVNRYYDVYGSEIDYMEMTELIAEFIITLDQEHKYSSREFLYLILDGVKDYVEFMRLSENVKDTAVVYIGGGVPKDFIQLFAVTADLLYPDRKVPNRAGSQIREGVTEEQYYPHKYAVQITTDSPQWGSLSGCTFDEAVSWGKETKQGRYIQCYCDATIALPIISHALAERLNVKREGRQFGLRFK